MRDLTKSPGTNGLGVAGLVLSILGVLTLGLLSIFGLALSLIALRRQPRTAATIGAILGAVGLLAFVATLAFVLGSALPNLAEAREAAMRAQGLSQVMQIHRAVRDDVARRTPRTGGIDAAAIRGFTTPETDELSPAAAKRLGVAFVDPWSNPFRITLSSTDPVFLVVSSDGPDGVAGTADDIVVPDDGEASKPDEPTSRSNGGTTIDPVG